MPNLPLPFCGTRTLVNAEPWTLALRPYASMVNGKERLCRATTSSSSCAAFCEFHKGQNQHGALQAAARLWFLAATTLRCYSGTGDKKKKKRLSHGKNRA